MQVTDLDGNRYKLSIDQYLSPRRVCSELHIKCRSLLLRLYPTCKIVEEIPIKINNNKTLFLDFFIPIHKLAIEVNGQQHYSASALFHGTDKLALLKQQVNDRHKQDWCNINNIKLIILAYNNINQWQEIIKHD